MSGRTNRDILLGDVDADAQTLGVDIREVTLGLLRILMGYICLLYTSDAADDRIGV